MIIQSTGCDIIKLLFRKEKFKELLKDYKKIFFTNSFEHALLNVPKEGKLIVITSNIFHDHMSEHRELANTISDDEKNANSLASAVKSINNRCLVYVYTERPSSSTKHIDAIMKKKGDLSGEMETILVNAKRAL